MTRKPSLAVLLVILFAAAAFAQKTTPAPVAPTQAQPTIIDNRDSRETHEEFRALLQRYPPELGRVLKLDPTLFGNEAYLANYPALAAFLTQHPEVAHSPRYYLDFVWVPGESTPESPSERVWGNAMEAISIFAAMLAATGVLIWLIKTLIAHRRWSRLSKIQTEVHTKLLDRFATNEELLAYIQTPAGKRFLESAPIQLDSAPQSISAPVGRILWSVQVGVVLAAAGLGLFFVSGQVDKIVAPPMFALGILAASIGAGFVISAFVSYAISRRLGLWAPAATPAAE